MKQELENKLLKDFSEFFKHRNNLKASLMAFGFACNDGWFNLVYDLCKDIKHYYETEYDGYEWDGDGNKSKCYHKVPSHFYVVQVKEKFGSLRFYITAAPQIVHNLISAAERESYTICERCGKKGKHRDGLVWILTLCDSCLDRHILERYHRERKQDEDFISDWQKEHKAPFIEVKA